MKFNQEIILSKENELPVDQKSIHSPELQIISIAREGTANDIDKIANYYLSGQAIPTGKKEMIQQLVLLMVSLSGATLYAIPANDFAKRHGSELAGNTTLERQINYIVGTCVPSLAILYNATDIFLTVRRNEITPSELNEYLKSPVSARTRKIQDSFILIGSAISAVPLTLVSIAYPPPIPINPLLLNILQAMVIEIDNTVLHFLPLKLATQFKIYRFPILLPEMLIKKIYHKYYPQQQQVTSVEAENVRASLIFFIQQAQRKLLIEKNQIHLLNKTPLGVFYYQWLFGKDFRDVLRESKKHNLLLALAQEFPLGNQVQRYRSVIHDWMGSIIGVGGAGWVATSCVGYLELPIRLIFNWLDNPLLTAMLSGPSFYFLTVLLTFFGYSMSKQLYEYLTRWGADEPKLPLEFKLYPKTFTMLMAVNLYLALYVYAAADEVIIDNFNDKKWDPVRPIFIWFAQTGLPFLSLGAIKDLSQTILRKVGIYLSSEDTKLVARMMTTLEQLENAVRITKPEVLSESTSHLEKIGICPKPDIIENKAINTATQTPQNQSWGTWLKSKILIWQPPATSTKSEERIVETTPLINSVNNIRNRDEFKMN